MQHNAFALDAVKPSPSPLATASPTPAPTPEIEIKCEFKGRYMVRTVSRTVEPGERVEVYLNTKQDISPKACKENKYGEVFYLYDQPESNFYDLVDDLILFDDGCCPPPRGLVVYNLKTKKRLFEASYMTVKILNGNTIEIWDAEDKNVGCVKGDLERIDRAGMAPITSRQILIDVKTNKVMKTKNTRCDETS